MNLCNACHEELDGKECPLSCCECESFFHLGLCSGIAASVFKKKRERVKNELEMLRVYSSKDKVREQERKTKTSAEHVNLAR